MNHEKQGRSSLPIVIWVVLCAGLNAAGWILSWFGFLNRAGYAIAFAGLAFVVWKLLGRYPRKKIPWRRFSTGLPRAWLILAAMIVLGAVLYPPSNYDALSYRIPRVLHWLAAERWHWIPANFEMFNTRAPGFEFLTAPILLFTGSDRLVPLINVAGFLLMPGLVFSVFSRLGVAVRPARQWMWIVPSGYCFILQAGGSANDGYGAVCALATMYFALRARDQRSWDDAALAIIAAALTTGAKSGNLPLLLPFALALLPSIPTLLRRPISTLGILALGVLVSLVPISLMNRKHAGTWFGSREDYSESIRGPWHTAIAGNSLLLLTSNLSLPVQPIAGALNRAVATAIPESLHASLAEHFHLERGASYFGELQIEDTAGLGGGVLLLAVAASCVGFRRRKANAPAKGADRLRDLIRLSPWVSFGAVILNNFMFAISRLLTPYYALLLAAPIGVASSAVFVMQPWWRRGAMLVMVFAGLVLIINPSRPLFPALTACSMLKEHLPGSGMLERIERVYGTYRSRPDVLAPVRALIPPGERVIGIVDRGDPEGALWRPFGSRWVKQVVASDTAERLRERGIATIAVSAPNGPTVFARPIDTWLQQVRGEIVGTREIQVFSSKPPVAWHVVRLRPSEE